MNFLSVTFHQIPSSIFSLALTHCSPSSRLATYSPLLVNTTYPSPMPLSLASSPSTPPSTSSSIAPQLLQHRRDIIHRSQAVASVVATTLPGSRSGWSFMMRIYEVGSLLPWSNTKMRFKG
ncbi:uncharacterized protein DS421_10g301990 [Arachis hypogaea]|nr:uncharacterized protein DS421_10g301990 [Arachis hypogaea]